MLCDMHTHSENSHDSNCKIEDMLKSQLKKGTDIFAVTEHFDAFSNNDYDIFTPLKRTYETVAELNQKYKDKCLLLAGVEIGEGFLFPEIYEKGISFLDYDVVIGSVHCVRFNGLEQAYSTIDFSKLLTVCISDYLNAYFHEILTLIDTTDFDILAHLTCPLRYIIGIYGFDIDISKFNAKIDRILKNIIEKGIALEVNTSSYSVLNDFMPGVDILKRYFDFGGRLVTLGSDAHVAENASIHFDKAVKALKEIGFDGIYYYKKRKPYKVSI